MSDDEAESLHDSNHCLSPSHGRSRSSWTSQSVSLEPRRVVLNHYGRPIAFEKQQGPRDFLLVPQTMRSPQQQDNNIMTRVVPGMCSDSLLSSALTPSSAGCYSQRACDGWLGSPMASGQTEEERLKSPIAPVSQAFDDPLEATAGTQETLDSISLRDTFDTLLVPPSTSSTTASTTTAPFSSNSEATLEDFTHAVFSNNTVVQTDNNAAESQASAAITSADNHNNNNKSSKDPSPPQDAVTPLPSDILFGRGKYHRENSGNQRMRELVNQHRAAYLGAGRELKTAITRQIVQALISEGARFLKKFGLHWCEVCDDTAREKVGHAMRDGRPR